MHTSAEHEAGRTGARHQVTLEVDCGQEAGVICIKEIRQQFKGECVLIVVTKTDEDNVEVLEGEVLAHSPHRHEIMGLLGRGLARDVAVEWCGEPDDSRVVAI
jgi:hypothetical protein